MPDLLIRDLSPDVLERLKAQAAAHGCSMQVEAKAIIERGVQLTIREWVETVRSSSARIAQRHGAMSGSSAELIVRGRHERDEAIDRAIRSAGDGGEDE